MDGHRDRVRVLSTQVTTRGKKMVYDMKMSRFDYILWCSTPVRQDMTLASWIAWRTETPETSRFRDTFCE